eukprot:128894-Rhodomonas_salina.3
MKPDEEHEQELTMTNLDGHQVIGENGTPSKITVRMRLVDRSFNVSLPPYKFRLAAFVEQNDITEDGPTPRQFAHDRTWRVPTLEETLEEGEVNIHHGVSGSTMSALCQHHLRQR